MLEEASRQEAICLVRPPQCLRINDVGPPVGDPSQEDVSMMTVGMIKGVRLILSAVQMWFFSSQSSQLAPAQSFHLIGHFLRILWLKQNLSLAASEQFYNSSFQRIYYTAVRLYV